jgi:hypothetical protein
MVAFGIVLFGRGDQGLLADAHAKQAFLAQFGIYLNVCFQNLPDSKKDCIDLAKTADIVN